MTIRARIDLWIPLLAAVASAALAARHVSVTHPDWLIARAAADTLVSHHGLLTYVEHERAQMGPLALLASLAPRPVYVLLVGFGLFVPLAVIGRLLRVREAGDLTAVTFAVGCVLSVAPWAQLAWKGHADDALALAGGVCALAALTRNRPLTAVGAYAVAVAGKPTAVAFLPLFLTHPAALAAAAAATAAVWAPFALADPAGFLKAGKGVMAVGAGSLADLLGYRVGGAVPFWVRPAQLLGAAAAVVPAVLARAPWSGLALAFTIRAAVETNPAPAYSIPVVVLAVACDVRRGFPLLAPMAYASWWVSQGVLDGQPGWPRLALLLLICGVAGYDIVRPTSSALPAATDRTPGGRPTLCGHASHVHRAAQHHRARRSVGRAR